MKHSFNTIKDMWINRRIGRRSLAFNVAVLFVLSMIPVTAIAEGEIKWETSPQYQLFTQQTTKEASKIQIQQPATKVDEQGGVMPDGSSRTVFCGKDEHEHTDECYELHLICGQKEDENAHIHTEKCYENVKKLVCGMEDGQPHFHDDSCTEHIKIYACGLKEGEGAHEHTAACYAESSSYICGLKEGEGAHKHTDSCVEIRLIQTCEEEEYVEKRVLVCRADHKHTDACFTIEKVPTGHVHDSNCYKKEKFFICGQVENKGHVHTDACVQKELELICGKEESKGHQHTDACIKEEKVFRCGLEEGETHWHTDACVAIDKKLICDEDEGHVHTEACYEKVLVCDKEEHVHTLACYSNPAADVVPKYAMPQLVANVELTGNWANDIIAIADSQVGYAESTENYAVTEQGQVKGYTQYGDWAGSPYGDWCASFVSFCATFAGIDIPTSAGCQNFQYKLMEAGLYREVGAYEPKPGDIVFFRSELDPLVPSHVGIVTGVTDTELETIEGNRTSMVERFSYLLDDESIMGYCEMPENQDYQLSTELVQSAMEAQTPEMLVVGNLDAAPVMEQSYAQTEIVEMQQAPEMLMAALPAQFIEQQITDASGMVTVSGMLPVGATVEAVLMTPEQVNALGLEGYTVHMAYDITLWVDGQEYEPETPVQVSINSSELPNNVEIQHLATDDKGKAVNAETLNVKVTDKGVSFTAKKFSPFPSVKVEKDKDSVDDENSGSGRAERP